MNQKTDSAAPPAAPQPAAPRKPRLSLLIATGFGLGYIPFAPGTFGSLAGLAIASLFLHYGQYGFFVNLGSQTVVIPNSLVALVLALLIALVGVVVSRRVSEYAKLKDPQFVVIDEVSGQMICLLPAAWISQQPVNWKYLLLGFILFRVFDIWKPFPARQAESLPGGWGIMADDWIAAVYAALGLWVARAFGM
ncbi:MAG TPA: phosphatidylglycerophosphatase A [Candidatus Acidoferrales bacterium]|jgi:phosphatidylglycerophosphatase A|nr:phosphatidylglycerophosphatase A [Candidatus Acidoferrales bacterium]